MAFCRRCIKNGLKRDGGDLGVCNQHRKTKCLICRAPSLGEELCAAHAHAEELARWKAKANLRIIDPEDEIDTLELRRAKLQQAKFLAFQAVELVFRAMLESVQAIWGKPQIDPEPIDNEAQDERKAA